MNAKLSPKVMTILTLGVTAESQYDSYLDRPNAVATIAMGQVIGAWIMAAVRHPEWAVGVIQPFLDDPNADATIDRILSDVPVSQYDGDSV